MNVENNQREEWPHLIDFLKASNSSMVITDAKVADHPIIFVNTAFEKMTGYSAEEVIGKNCRLLQGTDRGQSDREIISKRLAKNEACECLLRNYRKDGRMFWNKLYIFPFPRSGEDAYFVAIQHDVTEEHFLFANVQETALELSQLIETLRANRKHMERLSVDLVNSQEAERKALGLELHDEFGQRLCGLKMWLDRSQLYFQAGKAENLWSEAEIELTELIALVRQKSAYLRPPGLDSDGLQETLHHLFARQMKNGPKLDFQYTQLSQRLQPIIEITVFRIVQESITNILRHAQASYIWVEVSGGKAKDELTLTIYDNGVGFKNSNFHNLNVRAGLGLTGISERVHLLGGTFKIDSLLHSGTRIRVSLPLDFGENEINSKS